MSYDRVIHEVTHIAVSIAVVAIVLQGWRLHGWYRKVRAWLKLRVTRGH